MKVHIMFISDSDKHFSGAIQEYEKRLGNICILHQIKPVKYGTQSEIIAKETKKIEKELQKNTYKDSRIVLLEKGGKQYTSKQFSQSLSGGASVTFVLGGPYGLDVEQLSSSVDEVMSFGKHTMPHGLAKLVLFEQIYRASTIHANKKYHY